MIHGLQPDAPTALPYAILFFHSFCVFKAALFLLCCDQDIVISGLAKIILPKGWATGVFRGMKCSAPALPVAGVISLAKIYPTTQTA